MMEPKIIGEHYCANLSCHSKIGDIVELRKNVIVLDTGMGYAGAYHGVCKRCGAEIHWSMRDVALAALIHHTLELRDKIAW